jgi:hypothetical protein
MMEEEDYNFSTLDGADVTYNDGIYILATRRHFLSRNLEYRVAHIVDVEKLYDGQNPVPHMINKCFGDKVIFRTEEEATNEALSQSELIGGTDHGVGVIYAWEHKTFKQISGG